LVDWFGKRGQQSPQDLPPQKITTSNWGPSAAPGMAPARPLLLVPETVWQTEYRNFLCATCRFYPADPTNVFFLAGTLQAAKTLGLPLRANISPEEAHDFAVQIIGVLGGMYEKANQREAASLAYEGARGLGTIMTVKLFDPPQYEPEHKLFGPLLERDFKKLLPPNP
jgi:hypothetical protein